MGRLIVGGSEELVLPLQGVGHGPADLGQVVGSAYHLPHDALAAAGKFLDYFL